MSEWRLPRETGLAAAAASRFASPFSMLKRDKEGVPETGIFVNAETWDEGLAGEGAVLVLMKTSTLFELAHEGSSLICGGGLPPQTKCIGFCWETGICDC